MSYKNKPLHSYHYKIIHDVDDADWMLEDELEEQLEEDKEVVLDMLKLPVGNVKPKGEY